jgi:Tol biopolymer transport system component/DNA-binding winged helix-turn-helix (wHTH) protein
MARNSSVFRFLDVEVREGEFRLLKAGIVVPVEPRAFHVLLFLLRNPDRLISKDELLDAVWGDVSVSENALTRTIALLRKLLGDDSREPRYIATVPTVGYRLLCHVVVSLEPAVDSSATSETDSSLHSGNASGHSASASTGGIKYGRVALFSAFAALSLVITTGGLWIRWHGSHRGANPSSSHLEQMRSTVLVSVAGSLQSAAFSPDGKEIAYVWDGENPGRSDVYIQIVGAEKPLRLTRTTTGFTCCVSWSPDGNKIAYAHCDDNGGSIFMVPTLGGAPRRLADLACAFGIAAGWPLWSADGESLFITDSCHPNGPSSVMQLSLSTGRKECLSEPVTRNGGDEQLALSPNQKMLAFVRMSPSDHSDIFTFSLSSRALHQITAEGKAVRALMWSADGQNIIFRSSRAGVAQVWRVPAAGGPIERETSYPAVGSLTSDGHRMAFVKNQGSWPTSITEVRLSSPGGGVLGTKDAVATANLNDSPQLSPDRGQIVFASDPADDEDYGGGEIWKIDRDGTDAQQLTSTGTGAGTPRWSPDANKIAYDNHPGSHAQIWEMDADGRNQSALISDHSNNVVPSFSRDGRWLYFASDRTGRYEMWKKELDSGREIQVTDHGGFNGLESTDGKDLYYSQISGSGVWTVPVGGGVERRLTNAPHFYYWGWFTVCAYGLYLLDTDQPGGPEILFYNFHDRRLKPVFTLSKNPLPWSANLTSSPDGRTLLFVQYKKTSSIVMVENFR